MALLTEIGRSKEWNCNAHISTFVFSIMMAVVEKEKFEVMQSMQLAGRDVLWMLSQPSVGNITMVSLPLRFPWLFFCDPLLQLASCKSASSAALSG